MLKAILTLTYEKKIKRRDIQVINDAIIDNDDQFLDEFFGIGYDSPTDAKVVFYNGDKVGEED